MEILKTILLFFCALYLVLTCVFYFIQRRMIYIPPEFALADCKERPTNTELWSFQGEQGVYSGQANERLVIIYHGNASSSCYWDYLNAPFWQARGYDVLIPEYPGYNLDPRTPSKANFETMVTHVEAWRNEMGYQRVILIGSSLGAANASYHATLGQFDEVILYAPFDSLKNVARDRRLYFPSFLIRDPFDNEKTLQKQSAPVTIFHGENDITILPARSKALYEALVRANKTVERVSLPNIGHNDINTAPLVRVILARLAEKNR